MNLQHRDQIGFLDDQIHAQKHKIDKLEQYQRQIRAQNNQRMKMLMKECKLSDSASSKNYSDRIQQYEQYMLKEFGSQISLSEQSVSDTSYSEGEKDEYQMSFFKRKIQQPQTYYIHLKDPVKPTINKILQFQLQQIKQRAKKQALKQFNQKKHKRQKNYHLFSKSNAFVKSNVLDLEMKYFGKIEPVYEFSTIQNIIQKNKQQIDQELNKYKILLKK